MNNQHTPGPWTVKSHENDTYTIHVACKSWESWAVAHIEDCTQDEANARLIAAAPDLLAALEDLLKTALSRGENPGLDEGGPVLDKARAAIAKAKSK